MRRGYETSGTRIRREQYEQRLEERASEAIQEKRDARIRNVAGYAIPIAACLATYAAAAGVISHQEGMQYGEVLRQYAPHAALGTAYITAMSKFFNP